MANKIDKDTIERVLNLIDTFGMYNEKCAFCAYENNCSEQDNCIEGNAKLLYNIQGDWKTYLQEREDSNADQD